MVRDGGNGDVIEPTDCRSTCKSRTVELGVPGDISQNTEVVSGAEN